MRTILTFDDTLPANSQDRGTLMLEVNMRTHRVELDVYTGYEVAAQAGNERLLRVDSGIVRFELPPSITQLAVSVLLNRPDFRSLCQDIDRGFDIVEETAQGRPVFDCTARAMQDINKLGRLIEDFTEKKSQLRKAYRIHGSTEKVCLVQPVIGVEDHGRFWYETDIGVHLAVHMSDIRFTEQEALEEAQSRVNKMILGLVEKLAYLSKQVPPRILTQDEVLEAVNDAH